MNRWLVKQEPGCYSYADLEKEGETLWDGVANALAQKHLRGMAPGDEVLFYHSGDEKAIVGIMSVAAGPEPMAEDEKKVAVRMKNVRRLANPVTLAAIKADPAFAEWELVRISRLSVMPVSDALWKLIEKIAKKAPETPVQKTKKPAG